MPRTKQQWLELARNRIHSILATYHCCPIRMLEAKISEAGPGHMRPNPLSLSLALQDLISAANVHVVPKSSATETPFYAPIWLDHTSQQFQALLATRRHLYLVHKGLTERNYLCSDVLESILDIALDRAGVSFISRFPTQNLPAARPLDFVVELNGTRFGGEAKNYREWLYPDSAEIWSTISKCCELEITPLFVARKLPYVSFLLFRHIGMIGYQTHFQFFHPVTEPELTRIKRVDGLGYKDIRCVTEPDAHMVNFLLKTLPSIGSTFASRFAAKRSVLQHFADVERLRDNKLKPTIRKRVFSKAWKTIVGGELNDDLSV